MSRFTPLALSPKDGGGQAFKKNYYQNQQQLKVTYTKYQRNKTYQLLLLSNEALPSNHYFLLGKPDTCIDIAFVST